MQPGGTAWRVFCCDGTDMTLRLYLIRHGETEWSLSGQHTGRTDLPLTAHGEDEARELVPWLSPIRFTRVLTSPLQRARRTCELAGLGATAEVEPDLAEWNYGDYEGRLILGHPKGTAGLECLSRRLSQWRKTRAGVRTRRSADRQASRTGWKCRAVLTRSVLTCPGRAMDRTIRCLIAALFTGHGIAQHSRLRSCPSGSAGNRAVERRSGFADERPVEAASGNGTS